MTAQEMLELIRGRFPAPAFAVLPMVRSRTGFGGQERYADALAMSLWPSRGHDLHGFEIKVSRADWLRELRNPDKADAIFNFCNYWWLVTSEGVVQGGELPSTWGLLVHRGRGLRTVAPAPALSPPRPPSLPFLASILRRASQVVTPDPIIREAEERGRKMERESWRSTQERMAEIKKSIDEFEDTAGVRINAWNAGNVGSAVRAVLNKEHVPTLKDLVRIRTVADTIKREIDGLLDDDGMIKR